MNGELLILFVILLLGLILCSFLGVKEGMENGQYYYGPNGASAIIETDSSGNNNLVVTTSNGTTTRYTSSDAITYTSSNGDIANVTQSSDGNTIVQFKDKNEKVILTLTKNTNTGNISATRQIETTVKTNNYDNYNHYNGSSYPTIFYGADGGTAKVIQTPNNNTIVITNKNGTTEIYYIDTHATEPSVSTYYGQNGGSARMITDANGKQAVEITAPNGYKIVYTEDNVYTYDSQDDTINQYDVNTNNTGADVTASTYYGPYSGQATTVTGPAGNTYSTYDSSAYYNSLPQGIPKSQIPSGEEDLYILKSQVVPPVCPKCPDPILQCPNQSAQSSNQTSQFTNKTDPFSNQTSQFSSNFDANKCPPCPPPARCPEPAFECKKVPNYRAFNPDTMPVPVLSDFSSFGM